MKPRPLVSIITPFYNARTYFKEAIESVIAQEYTEWELLLVDDGSSDGSTEIAKVHAEEYPDRIFYLEHEGHRNRGRSTSRNAGILRAKGVYIAFLDADDEYLPEKLSKQVSLLESRPEAGMVYGPSEYWYGWTGRKKDQWRDRRARLGIRADSVVEPPALLTLFLGNGGVVPCPCGLLLRKALVTAVGGFDESFQHLYEDQVFLAKVCVASPVLVDGGCWAKYRQHEASTCRTAIRSGEYHPIKLNPARLEYLKWLGAYLVKRNVRDRSLWRAYHRAMWLYDHPQFASIALSVEYSKRFVGVVLGASRRVLHT